MLVGVSYYKTYRSACRLAFKDTRENFYAVFLVASCGDMALSGSSTVKFLLDEFNVNIDTGRHAIYDTSYCLTVTFTERGKGKYLSECI